jgi:hypothetical protein
MFKTAPPNAADVGRSLKMRFPFSFTKQRRNLIMAR